MFRVWLLVINLIPLSWAIAASPLHPADTEMILVPSGWFIMGSEYALYEGPPHPVYLDAFYIDKYEVTNGMYRAFCDATGRPYPLDPRWGGDYADYFIRKPDYPVVNVSWDDAAAYAKWAKKRLPTEAEWEKAARGEEEKIYPWGDDWHRGYANHADSLTALPWSDPKAGDGYRRTAPVGAFPSGASVYGVMDMAGNVMEWVADWYFRDYYKHAPKHNPIGPALKSYTAHFLLYRVMRGGAWFHPAQELRVTARHFNLPGLRFGDVGFRCAASVKGQPSRAPLPY